MNNAFNWRIALPHYSAWLRKHWKDCIHSIYFLHDDALTGPAGPELPPRLLHPPAHQQPPAQLPRHPQPPRPEAGPGGLVRHPHQPTEVHCQREDSLTL